MARAKSTERVKMWRETVFPIIERSGVKKAEISENLGYSRTWFVNAFSRGYAEFNKPEALAIASIIGVAVEDLTAIPIKETPPRINPEPGTAELIELRDVITEGFRMIHTDLRNLIETMDKYWKPEPPKYQIKEQEQP